MGNNLEGIPENILILPISVLAISPRVQGILRKANVKSIQDLIVARGKGLEKINLIGTKTAKQVDQQVQRFLQDSQGFSKEMIESLLDPRPKLLMIDDELRPNLVTLIIPFSKKLLANLQKDRDYEVIRRRYGLDGSDVYTLQEIGDYYGFSRENTRQLEARGVQNIKYALYQNPDKFKWRIPDNIVREAIALKELIQSGEEIQTENEIIHTVCYRYTFEVTKKEINALRFLLIVYGFQSLPRRASGSNINFHTAWHIKGTLNRNNLYQASKSVHKLLVRSVKPKSLFELTSLVNKSRKKKIGVNYVRYALHLCDQVEITNNERYQIKFEYLPSLADKAYRVLCEANKPLHFRGIWKEINHRLVIVGYPADAKIRSVTGQLADQKFAQGRFANIGRGGYWSLSEWEDVRVETIIELMKEFFHLRQSSATTEEVYDYVASRRQDVSKQSIYTYLRMKNDVFIKVGEKYYELTTWGGKEYKFVRGLNTKNRTMSAIRDIYNEKGVKSIPLSVLVRELAGRLGLAQSTIRNQMPDLPIVKLEKNPSAKNYQAKIAIFTEIEEIERKPKQIRQSHKITIRKRVQTEILNYLLQQPGEEALVADVATFVMKKIGCKKPTFYRYLGEMDMVAKRKFRKQLYCYVMRKTASDSLAFPKIELIDEPNLKENLVRATNNLTIENVDNGLFQLGRLFENELKSYLQDAKTKGAMIVTRNDLSRLANMIDCIERTGIVKNKHHLTFLRQERNKRAHGIMPTLQERQRLMEQAPFLGGLFVDYITFFHEKRKEIS